MPGGREATEEHMGTSLVVQWLRLQAPNAGASGSIPGQGTRSHKDPVPLWGDQ